MKILFSVCVVLILLSSCNNYGIRTDVDMFNSANELFMDYLFEYGIDRKLLSPPSIESLPGGAKSYKWVSLGSKENLVSVEITVAKEKVIKPKLILTGNNDAWLHLMNTKERKKGRHYF